MAKNLVCEQGCFYEGYDKKEIDNLLKDKANTSEVYTKNDVYNKTETNNLLNNKANSSNVYTKEESNNLLNNKANSSDVILKGDIAILTGSVTGTSGGYVEVSYPSGFTSDNCLVIGAMINNYGGSSFAFGTGLSSATNPNVRLKSSSIRIEVFTDTSSESTYSYRVALMKMN